MRLIGLDLGTKRIGVAVSDPLGITAQGLTVLDKAAELSKDLENLKKIIANYEKVDRIIIGFPKKLSGEIGQAAQAVQAFADFLQSNLDVPIELWDERLTTAAAEKHLISAGLSRQKRKGVIDKMAAAYILQSYLDAKKR